MSNVFTLEFIHWYFRYTIITWHNVVNTDTSFITTFIFAKVWWWSLSAQQEKVIGSSICQHWDQCFHGFLPLIELTTQDMHQSTGLRWMLWKKPIQVRKYNEHVNHCSFHSAKSGPGSTYLILYCVFRVCSWLDAAQNLKRYWTVQRQQRYGFSSIACDQAIEQTANRDSKTKGGLIGFTLNKGAVNRWILSQSERSAITRQCQIMSGAVDNER